MCSKWKWSEPCIGTAEFSLDMSAVRWNSDDYSREQNCTLTNVPPGFWLSLILQVRRSCLCSVARKKEVKETKSVFPGCSHVTIFDLWSHNSALYSLDLSLSVTHTSTHNWTLLTTEWNVGKYLTLTRDNQLNIHLLTFKSGQIFPVLHCTSTHFL